ncbi:electron transport complex subunit RsxG [Thalassotalea castellviae]|uniref:Ion-translocating oxidoreductase complex subunit G n=1 Tax=Thalassotalea castellviae TaxID=3075612 RepID=A0ABU3A3J8_9GAMM|nr:electron transport complex subunit RsxG [Thalassotalea sp. W431]MDT0604751.1 electron transport complex subunit RsxG [Thalassotalea sp. W431]
MRNTIEKNAKLLALFAVACTALIAFVNFLTKDKIKEQEQQQLISTLSSIIDPNSHNNSISQTCIIIKDTQLGEEPQKAYLATNNNTPIAAAITTTAPDGYNGNIFLLVAINIDGSISGVRTIKHQETPGLGDKVELRKSQWILSFNGKQILDENDNRWGVAKDGGMFDQFTGATITPRAVVNAVKRTTNYFNQHKAELFNTAANCSANAEIG